MYRIICEHCGTEFEAERPRRFCKPRCGIQAKKNLNPVKICYLCGAEFHPINNKQVTCGAKDCVSKHQYMLYKKRGYKYKKNEGVETKPKGKKKPTAKKWHELTPSQRWELMTWEEITAECARLHISYGQAQVLKDRRELPFDFGEKRGTQ
jgi:hypothetical protein